MAAKSTTPAEEVKVETINAQVGVVAAESSICEPQSLEIEAGSKSQEPAPKASGPSKSKKCFKKREKYLVMSHFMTAVALNGAPDKGWEFFPDPFVYKLFIFFVMLGCFVSITGIFLTYGSCNQTVPFHLTAFPCALLSLVLLFDALLLEVLRSTPWIFTAFMVPRCLIPVVHQN